MDRDRALELLSGTGALREGHFELSSGRHSARYVQCARLLARPDRAAAAAADVLGLLEERDLTDRVDLVCGPATGGIVWAYELGRQLGRPAIFCEKEADGAFALRRGFAIEPGAGVLLAEDVITTGGSVERALALVENEGAEAVAVAAVVDRSSGAVPFAAPLLPWVELAIPTWTPDACPICREGGPPPAHPGSRPPGDEGAS